MFPAPNPREWPLMLAWVLIHAFAFPAGWWLGANDFDAVGLERSLRNAFYGLFIGGCQALVLWRLAPLRRAALLAWPVASAIGFSLGVLLVKTIEPSLPPRPPIVSGLFFGVCIAPMVVLCTAAGTGRLFRFAGRGARLWWLAHGVGWVVVEVASARLGYQGVRIVIVGLLLGLITAWPLALLAASARGEARPAP